MRLDASMARCARKSFGHKVGNPGTAASPTARSTLINSRNNKTVGWDILPYRKRTFSIAEQMLFEW